MEQSNQVQGYLGIYIKTRTTYIIIIMYLYYYKKYLQVSKVYEVGSELKKVPLYSSFSYNVTFYWVDKHSNCYILLLLLQLVLPSSLLSFLLLFLLLLLNNIIVKHYW